MKCPFCGEDDTRVIDSRPADENMSIRRRRQCDKCQKQVLLVQGLCNLLTLAIRN